MSQNYNDNYRHKKARLLVLAETGNADAQYELGMLYKLGNANNPPNPIAAERWLRKSAMQQHKQACYELKKLANTISSTIKPKFNLNSTLKNLIKDKPKAKEHNLLKSNVKTPFTEICRQITKSQLKVKKEGQSLENLPPTIRHLSEVKPKALEIQSQPQKKEKIQFSDKLNSYKSLHPEIINAFHQLTGLEEIKKSLAHLAFQAQNAKNKKKSYIPGLSTYLPNLLLIGNPGSGKKTIAHLSAQIFHSIDILESDIPIEIQLEDLSKVHIDDIEQTIKNLFQQAKFRTLLINDLGLLCNLQNPRLGHVIFNALIDHSIKQKNETIVIGTCLKHRHSNLKSFYPKLESFFQQKFIFEDLTSAELSEIYQAYLKQHQLSITAEALHYVNSILQTYYRTRDYNFQNAHIVENLFNTHLKKLQSRLKANTKSSDNKNLITINDVEL